MPGPIIKTRPIDAANLASKLPEPLQQPGGMGLQLLMDAIGADDPMSGMYPAGPVAPMVSLFPDKAAREAGSARFLESIKTLPGELQRIWQQVAEDYPRITAHMHMRDPARTKFKSQTHNAMIGTTGLDRGRTGPGGGMPVTYGAKGLTKSGLPALDTAYHETTHAAQRLGLGRDYNTLYSLANDQVGYTNNPFEQGARMAGGSRTGRLSPNEADMQGTTAIQRLMAIIQGRDDDPNAMAIKEVLRRRGTIDPTTAP